MHLPAWWSKIFWQSLPPEVGLDIWAPIQIQWSKNMPGYDTDSVNIEHGLNTLIL